MSNSSRSYRPLSVAIAAAALLAASSAAVAQKPPEETLASLTVPDGMEVTLWATEPGLVNPTNMDIDERGRVWITEGANYRGSVTRPEGDRIVIIEDTDQDGTADSYKTFFQDPSLFSPLGICKVGNKLYVSQSPNMLVFTIDESGDKPVGAPEVVYTGFSGENHDHGLHAAIFGPDGRFYFNAGNDGCRAGGPFTDGKGNEVIDTLGSHVPRGPKWRGKDRPEGSIGYQEGMAFRFNPDGTGFETLGYNFRNNYEVTVDSFGTVWQSDNDDDGNQSVRINYVMEGGNFGYKGPQGFDWGRDRDMFPDQTVQEAHWHLRWPGTVPNMLHTGGGSPTGILVYEGDLLPEKYRGALIHCDPGPNVVRAYIPTPSSEAPDGLMELNKAPDADKPGAGYMAEVVELIKGGDSWFRPSDVTVAPDGSVFVCDWYDPGVGGHATGDRPEQGGLKGRIYRLAPKGHKPSKPQVDVNSVEGAIAALKSPNLATRYLGYNKLVSNDAANLAALKDLYQNAPNPLIKARALWLLARSAEANASVDAAMQDENPNIRIAALRAARLIQMDMVEVAKKMMDDKSPMIHRELALAMNYEPDDRAIPVLVQLADKYDGKDRWYLEALGIGATGREQALLAAWKNEGKNKDNSEVAERLEWRLGGKLPGQAALENLQLIEGWYAFGPFDSGAADAGNALAHDFGPDKNPASIDTAATAQSPDGKPIKWEKIGTTDGPGGAKMVDVVQFCQERGVRGEFVVVYFATTIVSPEEQSARLLVGSDDGVRVWLNGELVHENDATRAVRFPDDRVTVNLKKGPNLLLTKLRQGDGAGGIAVGISPDQPVTFSDEFPSTSSEAKATSDDKQQPEEAKVHLTKDGQPLPSLAELASMPGHPAAGEAVFADAKGANCISCHQVGTKGRMIGPPLNTIGQKLSKAQILEAILYPNNAILMEYENWVVRTKKGDIVSGLKVADTPALISIKDTEGKYHDIPLKEIDRKVKQQISIMPEGISAAMTQQELVDLVAYLATLRNK